MGYNDKYPDMSAMYAVQFEYENKLKDKIKELETELDRTRKALDAAINALKEIKDGKTPVSLGIYMDINDALEQITALEQKEHSADTSKKIEQKDK